MINVIGIGGLPGTGKTTAVWHLINSLGYERRFRFGLLEIHIDDPTHSVILGRYIAHEGTFAGTDRLSMAVMPDAIAFLDWLKRSPFLTVIFEGDRLFSRKFMSEIVARSEYLAPLFLILKASEDRLLERYSKRGSNQSETWRKGRATKIGRIESEYDAVRTFNNNNLDRMTALCSALQLSVLSQSLEPLTEISQAVIR